MSVSSVCVRLADTLPWRIEDLQIECAGNNASEDGSELGILQRWRAREEDHTALRARFLTSSGFLSHKDLSKRNCCVKWKFLKVKRLLRKRNPLTYGEEEAIEY
jgi:hypothetical protein